MTYDEIITQHLMYDSHEASLGRVVTCPICRKKFKKTNEEYGCCCDACEEEYERLFK